MPHRIIAFPEPSDARSENDPYGFIGRDSDLLKLEHALQHEEPAILVKGISGVGKTTLVRGFLNWLNNTEGLDGCLWVSLIHSSSAECVINYMGRKIFGPSFLSSDHNKKLDSLKNVLSFS